MKPASLAICAFVGGLLPHLSDAHGRLTVPAPRNLALNGNAKTTSSQNAPTGNSPLEQDFVCRDTQEQLPADYTTVEAGGTLAMQWELTAKHIGDCFIYISCTPDLADLEKEWFKIADVPYCRDPSKEDLDQMLEDGRSDGSLGGPLSGVPVDITIPDFLAPSDHCILRWEWYALHQVSQVEYYAQCVDIKITANTAGVPEATPLPIFTHADQTYPNLATPANGAAGYRRGFATGNQFLATTFAVVSPNNDGTTPAPPGPTPAPPAPAPDTGGGTPTPAPDTIIDDGTGLCFKANTPLLDGEIDANGMCGGDSGYRCETGNCCSPNGFCQTPATTPGSATFCDDTIGDYRQVACSTLSNPGEELVQYEDVDNCIQVFCGDILSICNGDTACALEWADVDVGLNNQENVCGRSLTDNFAIYSLQCSCDNCGSLISSLSGEGDDSDGSDVAVIAGAVVGILVLGGVAVGGVMYARRGSGGYDSKLPSASTARSSTELTTKKKKAGWMASDANSVV